MRLFFLLVVFWDLSVCQNDFNTAPLFDPYRRIQIGIPNSQNTDKVSSILDVIQAVRATTMYTLLQTTGISKILADSGPYTVFAPTDEAFNRLSREAQIKLKHPDLLKHVLLYHIAPGEITFKQIEDEVRLPTLITNKTLITRVYADKKATVNKASIVVPDATASNGVVHVISDVIFPIPRRDVYDTLQSCPAFTKFTKLINITGLQSRLTDPEFPVTVFAPTDDAFNLVPKYIQDALENPNEDSKLNAELRGTVLYHVVAGTQYSVSLRDGQLLNTAADIEVEINIRNGRMREVGLSRVKQSDIGATNGVIYAIDRVLSPKSVCFL